MREIRPSGSEGGARFYPLLLPYPFRIPLGLAEWPPGLVGNGKIPPPHPGIRTSSAGPSTCSADIPSSSAAT